jgi:hypothetical protein
MAEIAAHATEQGTVLLTVMSDTGQRGQAELSADQAENLKAQLETALLAVRMRQIRRRSRACPKQPPQRGDRWTRSRLVQSGDGSHAFSIEADWSRGVANMRHQGVQRAFRTREAIASRSR